MPHAIFDNPQSGDMLATLQEAQAKVAAVSAWIKAHPKLVTIERAALGALGAAKVSWAADLGAGIDAAPGALAEATKWLPVAISALKEFQPAPSNGPPLTQGDFWQHPQPVDNPSGAIGGSNG
jgi:hypothetical protein